MWMNLIAPVAKLAGGLIKNKAEEKQAKHKAKMSMIKNDADWETKMAEASNSSFKDEFFVIVLSFPLFFIGYAVGVDDPAIIDRVKEGFNALNELPDWYQYLLGTIVAASFGFKGAARFMGKKK